MYAVIESGGKQYRVTPGDVVQLELLEAQPGGEVVFDKVLFLGGESITIGTPIIAGATVVAEVVEHGKGDKVMIGKYRKRKTYNRLRGHRQNFTAVKIKEIKVS